MRQLLRVSYIAQQYDALMYFGLHVTVVHPVHGCVVINLTGRGDRGAEPRQAQQLPSCCSSRRAATGPGQVSGAVPIFFCKFVDTELLEFRLTRVYIGPATKGRYRRHTDTCIDLWIHTYTEHIRWRDPVT